MFVFGVCCLLSGPDQTFRRVLPSVYSLCVCVYVYMYVCVYVWCVYVCVCVCVCGRACPEKSEHGGLVRTFVFNFKIKCIN